MSDLMNVVLAWHSLRLAIEADADERELRTLGRLLDFQLAQFIDSVPGQRERLVAALGAFANRPPEG